MLKGIVAKYISIIVILSAFMGSFHHHNDLKQHNDCQICTMQYNTQDIDIPQKVVYVSSLLYLNEGIKTKFYSVVLAQYIALDNARAPPSFFLNLT